LADIKAGANIPLAEMRLHDGVARLRLLENTMKSINGTRSLWSLNDFNILDPV
jgi:hypothetical protein